MPDISSTHHSPWHDIHCLTSESSSTHCREHLTPGPSVPSFLGAASFSCIPGWDSIPTFNSGARDICLSQSAHLIFLATVVDSGILVHEPVLVISTQRPKEKRDSWWTKSRDHVDPEILQPFCHHVKPENEGNVEESRAEGAREKRSWWGCLSSQL